MATTKSVPGSLRSSRKNTPLFPAEGALLRSFARSGSVRLSLRHESRHVGNDFYLYCRPDSGGAQKAARDHAAGGQVDGRVQTGEQRVQVADRVGDAESGAGARPDEADGVAARGTAAGDGGERSDD